MYILYESLTICFMYFSKTMFLDDVCVVRVLDESDFESHSFTTGDHMRDFSQKVCITQLLTLIFREVINCFLDGMPLSWKGLLFLWGKKHICSKILARHDALFLKECCAHLRALLQSSHTLYQRNVVLSVTLHGGMPQLPQLIPRSFKW